MARVLEVDPLMDVVDAHEVEYIVVGGFAVAAHGHVRATRDVDICPNPKRSNLRRLAAALEALEATPIDLEEFEGEIDRLGLRDVPITIRMTGCPNGCARPYTADLAFVGRSHDLYNVYVGGGLAGDRLVDLYRADVSRNELLDTVRPLLARWASERLDDEGLGDFYQRLMGLRARRTTVTGRELPTIELMPQEVGR